VPHACELEAGLFDRQLAAGTGGLVASDAVSGRAHTTPVLTAPSWSQVSWLSGTALVAYLALAKFLLHVATAGNYGYFRDEFYFMDAGRRLALGYVDFPPLVAVLAACVHRFLGTTPLAWRVLPAAAGALVVFLTGEMARRLGGGRVAQVVAALASLFAVTFLVVDSFFSMNPFDELWWALALYLVLLILQDQAYGAGGARPVLWLALGLALGLGLLTKESIVFLVVALALALLLAGPRRLLRTPWPWLAAGIALLGALPYLTWNYRHGWPAWQFWTCYQGEQLRQAPWSYFLQQVQTMNPVTLPLWLAGLYYYLRSEPGRPYRLLGWSFLILFVFCLAGQFKPYFLAPAYPMLFAAGACLGAMLLTRRPWYWLKVVYVGDLVLTGLILLPLAVPMLPPASVVRGYAWLYQNPALRIEAHEPLTLPQWLADRFGWEELAGAVQRAYATLPRAEQAAACVLAGNYGEAGALNYYAAAYGLPPALSGHNNYYLWGPGACSGAVLLSVGVPDAELARHFAEVTLVARVQCEYCMPEEQDRLVYIARRPYAPLVQWWPELRRYSMQ
jgi:hypothetical protein